MAGSTYGTNFKMMTWGESHGKGIGVVIDGCPAGVGLSEEDIQAYLNRRRPGQSEFTTRRKETDQVEILSGVFDGQTTGTPISLMIRNEDQHSADYSEIAQYYRPGHADMNFDKKYGFRDYRGGGRSSGRETAARVAAGAVACSILSRLGIKVNAYTLSIGPVAVDRSRLDLSEALTNPLYMPDNRAAEEAQEYLKECIRDRNSSGGSIECVITGMPAGVGDPVFDKLDACLAKAIFSIGAVKGFEIGDGFAVSTATGLTNNDSFHMVEGGNYQKVSNHSGGITGGMSDGCDIIFRAAVKPTPSIAADQQTVNKAGEDIKVNIKGRHDPVIVPRAVVVVESMAAVTLVDLLLSGMSSRMDGILRFYGLKQQ